MLLLKYAEGGTSLFKEWRSPTAAATRPKGPQSCGPWDATARRWIPEDGNVFCCENSQARQCGDPLDRAGPLYTGMVRNINQRLAELGTRGVDYDLALFGWFQGWSDASNTPDWVENEYEDNMVDFMKDVRVAFEAPDLPFVLAGPGMDGYGSASKSAVCNAQRRAAERTEFVEYVETRPFASKFACLGMDDNACDGLNEGACKAFIDQRFEEAGLSRSDCSKLAPYNGQGQHYSWNAASYFKVGNAMGEAAVSLLGLVPPSSPSPSPPDVCTDIPLVGGWQVISFQCIALNSNGGFDMLTTVSWGQDDRILSRDGQLATASYDGEKWQGSLSELSQEKGYKVFFSGPLLSILKQSGGAQIPLENVVLSSGWNWIGHAAFRPYNVNSGIEVVSGSFFVDDRINTRSGSSLFQCNFDGETFQGLLSEFKPGLGYEIFVKRKLVFKYVTTSAVAYAVTSTVSSAAAGPTNVTGALVGGGIATVALLALLFLASRCVLPPACLLVSPPSLLMPIGLPPVSQSPLCVTATHHKRAHLRCVPNRSSTTAYFRTIVGKSSTSIGLPDNQAAAASVAASVVYASTADASVEGVLLETMARSRMGLSWFKPARVQLLAVPAHNGVPDAPAWSVFVVDGVAVPYEEVAGVRMDESALEFIVERKSGQADSLQHLRMLTRSEFNLWREALSLL